MNGNEPNVKFKYKKIKIHYAKIKLRFTLKSSLLYPDRFYTKKYIANKILGLEAICCKIFTNLTLLFMHYINWLGSFNFTL